MLVSAFVTTRLSRLTMKIAIDVTARVQAGMRFDIEAPK